MRVEVRLFATLATHRAGTASGEPLDVMLEGNATLVDLIESLAIPPQEVHLAMIDGRIAHDHAVRLVAGNRIGLFPPVGGG